MGFDATTWNGLLASVADGVFPDWALLQARAPDDRARRAIENLRLVAGIAEFHRSFPGPAGAVAAVDTDHEAKTAATVSTPSAAASTERPPLLTRWGHFRLVRRVGEGSYGEVYESCDTQLERNVALKLLWPARSSALGVQRLLAEARMLARVRHQNVVSVFGAEEHDDRAGLWMEFVRGVTLERLLGSQGPFGASEAMLIGQDLCRALAAVHAAGLVHRDVKSNNVMREEGGRLVLMDFGAGRVRQASDDDRMAGTPLYVAPEVLAGAEADVRSDIYSLGVLLFHLVTRRYPLKATDIESLRAAHAEGDRIPLQDLRPDLPDAFVRVVEQALAKDPEKRYPSAGAMQAALGRALGFDLSNQTRDDARRTWWSDPWRRRAAVAVLSVGGLAAFAAIRPAPPFRGAPTAILVRSLAVLPFGGVAEGAASKDLGRRLAEDLSRSLQQRGIRTIGGESAKEAAGLPPAEIVERLGVDATLGGTLAPDGDNVVAEVRLAQASTGAELWSHRYREAATNVAALSSQLAGDLAGVIGFTADPRPPHTPVLAAFKAYTSGRLYAEDRSRSSLELAIRHYEDAARRDPLFAEPWAGMADAYIALGVPTFGALRPQEARRLANQAALKALELDPKLAEAQTSLAFISFFYDWDWAAAEQRFQRAIALNPYYAGAHWWYANHLEAMGRPVEATREIHRAIELEPLSILIQRDLGWHYFHQRKYDQAVEQLRDTLKTRPDYTPARSLLGRALVEAGRPVQGLAELEHAAPQMPRGAALAFLAYGQAAAGRTTKANETLAALRALPTTEYVSPYYVALVYVKLGRFDEALKTLDRAFEEQDTTLVNLKVDPRWDPIRTTPQYQALLKRLNYPS
jgi:eukaryotic-like serine/threonine-protein kinase